MDYWKHYVDEDCHNHTGLDLHEGGVGLGHKPGEDVPLYRAGLGEFSTSYFARVAAEWIVQHARLSPQPFFLYLAFQGVHSANNKFVQAPSDAIARFASISPHHTCGQYTRTGTSSCTAAAMRKSFAANTHVLDSAVGTVVAALKSARVYETTLLVFSSDNGGPTDGADANMASNFPLRGSKAGYYEGGVRAVGLVHGYGLSRRGYVNTRLHHVSDWVRLVWSRSCDN